MHLWYIYTKGQLEKNNVARKGGGGALLKNLVTSIEMVISKLWLGIFVIKGAVIKK